ncbi:MAG: hypothetical protein N2489_04385 [Clostridia bacterium]|nr:hypothetical protein [Clostridia bacterium]
MVNQHLENAYISLCNSFQQGIINEQQFSQEIEKLKFQDSEGRYWCISELGIWHWWDGQKWVEHEKISFPSSLPVNGGEAAPANSEKLPESFLELLKYILKKVPGVIMKRLPSMILTALVGLAIHTYMMVFINEGFNLSNNWVSAFLNTRGQRIGPAILWTAIGIVFPFIFDKIRSGQLIPAIMRLIQIPGTLKATYDKSGKEGLPLVLIGAGSACIIGSRLGWPTNLILGTALLSGLGNMGRSILMLLITTAWTDIKKWLGDRIKNTGKIDMKAFTLVMSGASMAFIVAAILPFKLFIGLALLAAGIFLKYNNKQIKTAVFFLVSFSAYFFLIRKVYADDGGWKEAGGSWGRWIRSQGAITAVLNGLIPGLSLVAGTAISSIIRDLLGSLGLENLLPPEGEFPEGDIPPEDQMPPDPEHRYWIEMTSGGGTLKTDGSTSMWIYAKVCSDNPDADTGTLTTGIGFSFGGEYGKLLKRIDNGYVDGYKCICITASAPLNLLSDQTSGSAVVNAGAASPNGFISASETVALELMGQNARLEHTTMPEGVRELNVGDSEPLWLYARVVSTDSEGNVKIMEEASDSISFSKASGGDWFELYETAFVEGGWKAVPVKALNPYGDSIEAAKAQPPASVTVSVRAAVADSFLSDSITFTINAKSEIEVDKNRVSLLSKSGASETVSISILNPGSGSWSLEVQPDSWAEKICRFELSPSEGNACWKLEITENDTMEKSKNVKSNYDGGELRLRALCEEKQAEATIRVLVMREGLYVDSSGAEEDGSFVLKADGQDTRSLIFYMYTWDEEAKKLVANQAASSELLLQYKETEDILIQNASSVTELDLKYEKPYMDTGSVYKASTVRPFPAKGEYIPVGLIMSGTSPKGDSYTVEFTIKVKTPDTGVGSSVWEKELEEISKVIDKLVPQSHRPKFYELVHSKKNDLSAEGLYVFRKEIIKLACELNETLAQGYLNDAAWYDKAVWWCEKLEIMGEIAISALEQVFLGPLAGVASGLVRQKLMSAYNAYVEGKTMEQWFNDEINGFTGMVVDMGLGFVTDPSVLEQAIGKSPKAQAAAWVIYVGYNFLNGLYKGMSVWDAAKHTAQMFTQRQAVQFLAGKMQQTKCVYDQQKALKELENMRSRDIDGDHSLPPGVAEKIMRDPEFVRSIKNHGSEELKAAFENSMRKDVYAPHDQALVGWIKDNVPGMGGDVEVKVHDFRTPRMDGDTQNVNVNADRDYRVMYKDPETGQWKELRKDVWEHKSYEEFAKHSGFSESNAASKLGIDEKSWEKMSHEQKVEAWARSFRQTATDASHIVSSRDFSDQVINPETGKPFTKLDANGNEVPASNIELVKAGKSKLLDPKGMGEMYERKVFDEWKLNGSKSEGVEQIKKGFKELEAVREGYKKQGIDIDASPEYQKLKNQFENISTDLSGKHQVGNLSERDMNKALAHIANEFKKFPPLGK